MVLSPTAKTLNRHLGPSGQTPSPPGTGARPQGSNNALIVVAGLVAGLIGVVGYRQLKH